MTSAYDQTQYESYSYSQTHPEHLFTMGSLFGLKPADFRSARVLELGCASGGNLIPIAFNYPETKCVGIDLSTKQIETGKQLIDKLTLSNIQLKAMDLMDFGQSFGTFDYIICHGLYSWIDEKHQNKILDIFQNHLNPQGIAYMSYNTYPGWRMVQSIRDMMLYHTQGITEPTQKAQQARALLSFIAEGLEGEQTSYAEFLKQEIQILKNQPDSYLLHDHLEEHNLPLYFYQLIEKAAQHHLSYLSDASLVSMFVGNLPQAFAQELSKVDNIILTNQYMDFIRNQRFRSTLFCHDSVKVDRQLNSNAIEQFYLSYGGIKPTFLPLSSIEDQSEIKFVGPAVTLTSTNPIAKAAMKVVIDAKRPIAYEQMLTGIESLLNRQERRAIEHHLNNELKLLRLVLGGLLNLHATSGNYASSVEAIPQTTPLVLAQLEHQAFVTNQRHETVRINHLEGCVLQLLDGHHDKESIVQHLFELVQKGTLLVFDAHKNKLEDESKVKEQLNDAYHKLVDKFADQALLIH